MTKFSRRKNGAETSSDSLRMIAQMERLKATASYRVLEQRMVFDGAAADTAAQVAEASDRAASAEPA
ncbi:MAG: hypothetical protein AB1749_03590, partial [Pseudomonadota bacterium]